MPANNQAYAANSDRITEAARYIQRLADQSALHTALAIGRYLLEAFYEGDFDGFHDRRGGQTIRALAAHPEIELSAAYLYSSVAVLEQVSDWPPALTEGLSLSHHRQLLAVGDRLARQRLAAMCWESGWSCSRLAGEIERRHPAPETRRGRPPKPLVVRCAEQMKEQLERIGRGEWEDAERLFGRLSPDEAFDAVEDALRDATELGNRLRRLRVLARSRR